MGCEHLERAKILHWIALKEYHAQNKTKLGSLCLIRYQRTIIHLLNSSYLFMHIVSYLDYGSIDIRQKYRSQQNLRCVGIFC